MAGCVFKMFCHVCNRIFASKYTLKRHVAEVHGESTRYRQVSPKFDTCRPCTDIFSDSVSNSGSEDDQSMQGETEDQNESDNETDVNTDVESDDETNNDEESPKQRDFWALLIRRTVESIRLNRLLKGNQATAANPEDLLEGNDLSTLLRALKNEYSNIKAIYKAGKSDSLLAAINRKAQKIERQFEEQCDDVAEESDDIAWEKYKIIVKKKLADNIDELACFASDSESDDD